MWREAWCFVGLERRRWWRESGASLVVRRAIQAPNGQSVVSLAVFLSIVFFFGFFTWAFSLVNLSESSDGLVWVIVFFLLLVFFHPLLQPFPDPADREELRFLQAFPRAAAASLLGRLIWGQWKVCFFSAAILGAVAIARTVTGGSHPVVLFAWWLYQTAGVGLGLLFKAAAHWGRVRLGLWESKLKKNKSADGFQTGLAKWLVSSALYFAGGLVAYHLATWVWRTVQTGWRWTMINSALPSQWKSALDAILFRPSLWVIGLAAIVLAAVATVLPFLVHALVRDQTLWQRKLDAHPFDHKPHPFTGEGMILVMQKDLLHFFRVPRSQKALSSLVIAFFVTGVVVEMARHQSFGRHPWGLLMASLVGTYCVTFFGQDVVHQTTGPTAEGERFTLYRLTAISLESVIWGKVLLGAVMMAIPALILGVVLVLTAEGPMLWMPAVVLVGMTVPFLEALVRAGVPAFLALSGQASEEGWNRLKSKVIPEILSAGYLILWLDLLGIPTILSVAGKGNVAPKVEWAYAAILVPVGLLAGVMNWWWRRRFARY